MAEAESFSKEVTTERDRGISAHVKSCEVCGVCVCVCVCCVYVCVCVCVHVCVCVGVGVCEDVPVCAFIWPLLNRLVVIVGF